MQIIGKVRKKLKNGTWYPFYNAFYEQIKPDSHIILMESRSGKALESNILAILRELNTKPYESFRLILSVKKDSQESVEKKLKYYGLRVDKLVHTGTVSYYYYLSKAGYLVNDTSFPGRFIKKEGQVYLNTWHGTPLKKMGRDNQEEVVSMGNIMRNLLCADYLLFPNRFMEEKMVEAYMLRNLYQGILLHEGYPRNDIFRFPEKGEKLKVQQGYEGKRLVAYLPTFRGNFQQVEEKDYLKSLKEFFSIWDAGLDAQEMILVKLHPFVNAGIDFSEYSHIQPFPGSWDTYDGLNACDVLITDYSSVMYDYANSGRKVILFAYDRAEYEGSRGIYEDMGKYPFQLTVQAQEVLECLHREGGKPDKEFMEKYATYEDGKGAEKICRHVFLKEKCCRTERLQANGRENVLIYGGNLAQNGITTALFDMLEGLNLEKFNYFLSFRMSSIEPFPERVNRIPDDVGVYPLASEMNMDLITGIAHMCYMRFGWKRCYIKNRIQKAYKREWKKHFGNSVFRHAVHYNGYENYITSLFKEAPCTRTIWVHSDMEQEMKMRGNQNKYVLREAYRNYEHVAVISEGIIESVYHISGRRDNIQVIENCHDSRRVLELSQKPVVFQKNTQSTVSLEELQKILESDVDKFISIGRYSPEKGHDRLIRAFAQYWKKHPETYLIIIGGVGELYEKTIELAQSVEAGAHIVLIKSMENPMSVLKRCNLFILASYYEGWGLVLLEADTLGVPLFSCDISGPRAFMKEHGGLLVENSQEGIYQGMEKYAAGQIFPMNVDYVEMNRISVRKCEQLL